MLDNEAEYHEKLIKAFTPNRPIDLPEFLSGRSVILYKALDAARTPGLHMILFGERGTGKTSIARVLAHILQEPERPDGCRTIFVQCNSSDDYSSIWQKVIQSILLRQSQLGFLQQQIATIRGKLSIDAPITDTNDARIAMESLTNPTIIVIDEFDRVPMDSDARPLMADIIKLFSDSDIDCKLVLVGVAESIAELISEHQSIARNMLQILVEPMTVEELAQIIQKGFKYVGLHYEDGLDIKIAQLSQGYPHYTHLLGLWTARHALAADRDEVMLQDINGAIADALENTIGSVRQEYELGIASVKKNALYKDVLLACALAPKDSLGRFSLVDVRAPLRQITGREYNTGAYQAHLAALCTVERGQILKRSGKPKNYRWKFVNPQLITYVRLQGVKDGRIS
jgi:Cdc6-like AAA superfamily ATPase